jgi:hypothetical protein
MTPPFLCEAILPHVIPQELTNNTFKFQNYDILEPSCGSGNFVKSIQKYVQNTCIQIHAYDIDNSEFGLQADFLTHDFGSQKFDLIVGNPPYSLALDFVKKALTLRKYVDSKVCFLLRLNWLGSQKRAEFLRKNTPSIYVTPKRPIFKGKSSDATEYCYCVWGSYPSTVNILETDKVNKPKKEEVNVNITRLPMLVL